MRGKASEIQLEIPGIHSNSRYVLWLIQVKKETLTASSVI